MFSLLRHSRLRAVPLVRVLSLSLFGFLLLPFSVAQAANNVLISITLQDTNANGKINRAVVSVDNDTPSTAAVKTIAGWSATDGGAAVTVSAVALASAANADPLLFNIDLDENDADLTVDTLNADLEIIYAQQGADAGTEYTDAGDVQLVAVATGDAGTNTEVDAAAPVVTLAQTLDVGTTGTTHNGKVDHLKLTFSEAIDDSAIQGYAAAVDYTPTSLALANVTGGAIDAVEILSDVEDNNLLYIIFTENASTCSATVFTGCDTAVVNQDITWTGASATIQDAAGNAAGNLATGGIVETDKAEPFILGANYYDNNSNGTIDNLVVIFSENVSDASYVNRSSTISAGGTLTTAAIVAAATVALDAAANDKWITLAIASGTANTTNITGSPTFDTVAADMIDDANGNSSLDQDAVALTDKANPLAISWVLDMSSAAQTATLTFSESVTAAGLTVTAMTIQNAATATISYVLTNSTTASSNGASIVIDLSDADFAGLLAKDNLAKSSANTYLVVTTSLIADLVSNANRAIANGAGLQVTTFTSSGGGGSASKPKVCIVPEVSNFSSSAAGKVSFDIKLKQNSPLWSNFTTPRSAMTVKLDGVQVLAGNITLRYGAGGVIVADVALPSSVTGSAVSVFASIPSQSGTKMCYAEATQSVTLGGGAAAPSTTTTPSEEATPEEGTTPEEEVMPEEEMAPEANMSEEGVNKEVIQQKVMDFEDAPKSFGDVSANDWSSEYINKVSAAGIMTGYDDGSQKFGKADPITNAQLVKVGLESFGYDVPESASEAPYSDVDVDDWSARYLAKAKEIGVTPRVLGGKINPHTPINRGETLRVLAEMAGVDLSDISDSETGGFTDVSAGKSYTKAVVWAVQNGIVSGYAGGTQFGPYDSLTREQLAKVVVNMLEYLSK